MGPVAPLSLPYPLLPHTRTRPLSLSPPFLSFPTIPIDPAPPLSIAPPPVGIAPPSTLVDRARPEPLRRRPRCSALPSPPVPGGHELLHGSTDDRTSSPPRRSPQQVSLFAEFPRLQRRLTLPPAPSPDSLLRFRSSSRTSSGCSRPSRRWPSTTRRSQGRAASDGCSSDRPALLLLLLGTPRRPPPTPSQRPRGRLAVRDMEVEREEPRRSPDAGDHVRRRRRPAPLPLHMPSCSDGPADGPSNPSRDYVPGTFSA